MPFSVLRAGRTLARFAVIGSATAATAAALLLADGGALGNQQADRTPASKVAPGQPASATPQGRAGQAFGGVAAVGALFTGTPGKLGQHFCTASVVHSSGGDLALTAAHCVTKLTGPVLFVPGYANGQEPFGVWLVTRVYTDQAWESGQDPDHDVAFIRLAKAASGMPIEDVTGAEQLGTGRPPGSQVRVIGYPDDADQPVWCDSEAKSFSATQLEFDCGGYPGGTSGGPFLADVNEGSGLGTVIGVIGGYQQGGDTPDVSYSVAFGASVASLYQRAQADG